MEPLDLDFLALKGKDALEHYSNNQTPGSTSHEVSAREDQQDQSAKKVREAKSKPLISPSKTTIQHTQKANL